MKRIFTVSLFFSYCLFLAASFLAASSLPRAETPQNLLDAGRPAKAVQTLERQIEATPTAEAYNLLCRAQFELDAWDAGIPACEKATSMAPHNALYHLWLGRIYGEKAARTAFFSAAGLAKKVRAEFERAVQFAPDDWHARTDLAEFYVEAPGIVGGGKDKARSLHRTLRQLRAKRGTLTRCVWRCAALRHSRTARRSSRAQTVLCGVCRR